MSNIAKNRINSTWTPLCNEGTNNKIFEERLELIGKWFKHWNDDQRKKLIDSIISKSKMGQIEHTRDVLSKRLPIYKDDFTRLLPRVLSLYVFSYLDPRSLCRCAQVSWHWRYLSESDQLWMPKSVRFGWTLPFTPSQFEQGIWKRNYIENIQALQAFHITLSPQIEIAPMKKSARDKDAADTEKRRSGYQRPGSVPWRGADKKPTDTFRFNYLDNDDEIERIKKLRQKGLQGTDSKTTTDFAQNKVKTGPHFKITSLRTRSKSLTKLTSEDNVLSNDSVRPHWANKPVTESVELRSSVNASIRPAPLRQTVVKRIDTRSERDLPSSNLFPNKPWTIVRNEDDSD